MPMPQRSLAKPASSTPQPDFTMTNPEQKKKNLRTALILASVAVAFMLGFMVKMIWLGK
jgi:hypothetical protein